MQIGFIGIGVMGRPMTLNFLKAGHNVTIYARHPGESGGTGSHRSGSKACPLGASCRYGFGDRHHDGTQLATG